MVVRFRNVYLKRLFEGKTLRGKPRFGDDVASRFKKTVLFLKETENISQLRRFVGLKFEPLKGKFKGKFSVRLNRGYRLILSVEKGQSSSDSAVLVVEEITNHYQ
jgi:proteic killer suppression protein